MKKFSVVLLSIFIFSLTLQAQKITVKTDEFTGEKTISSSWELLHYVNAYYYRFTKQNDIIYFEFASPTFDVSAFTTDDTIRFKSESDNILELYNQEYKISSRGGGSIASYMLSQNISVHLYYKINKDDMSFFLNNLVELVRYDYDTLKGKKYRDAKISNGYSKKIQKTYKKFIEEVNKPTE